MDGSTDSVREASVAKHHGEIGTGTHQQIFLSLLLSVCITEGLHNMLAVHISTRTTSVATIKSEITENVEKL